MGEPLFHREFYCEFQAGEAQIITRELLARAIDNSYRPLNNGKSLFPDIAA